MLSHLESLSTEVFFEIFEYLSYVNLFRAFTDLNYHLHTILTSYPLQLNLQRIFRSDFTFLCRHILPKQVLSIVFSEETMPDQVKLFQKYFPEFEHQFINLRSINFFKMENFILNLPQSVSCLSFDKCLFKLNYENSIDNMHNILVHQSKVLTHLNIQYETLIPSTNIQLSLLTHLTINSFCLIDRLHEILQYSRTSITSLNVSLLKDNEDFSTKLEKLCQDLKYLKDIKVIFDQRMVISFNLLEQCLNYLSRLTHLTIEATGTHNLLDGNLWEEFLKSREIVEFNFKFSLAPNLICNQDEFTLLKPFRSLFWLEEKHWYVGCYKTESNNKCPSIYSVPYFLLHSLPYRTTEFRPLSTVPCNMEKKLLYDNRINNLECYFLSENGSQSYRYTKVNSLCVFHRHSEFNVKILSSIVDLGRVRILDISSVDHIPASQLHILLEHTPRLYHLIMRQQHESLILPSHIRSLHLKRSLSHDSIDLANIDQLRSELSHVRQLEIKVPTQEMMIEIIERFDQLESIIFQWSGFLSAQNTSFEWFQQNTRRLRKNSFACRTGTFRERDKQRRHVGCGYVPPKMFIFLSITKNDVEQAELETDRFFSNGWLNIFQQGWKKLFHFN